MTLSRATVLATIAALASCDCVTSSHPVGDEVPPIERSQWEGRWSLAGESDQVLDIEVVDPANGVFKVAACPCGPEERPHSTMLRRIGRDLFASLPLAGEPPEYVWFRVVNQDDAILIWRPDASKFRKLVDAGVLPGQKEADDVKLGHLSADHLELIVSDDEGGLFDWKNPFVLHRVSR